MRVDSEPGDITMDCHPKERYAPDEERHCYEVGWWRTRIGAYIVPQRFGTLEEAMIHRQEWINDGRLEGDVHIVRVQVKRVK